MHVIIIMFNKSYLFHVKPKIYGKSQKNSDTNLKIQYLSVTNIDARLISDNQRYAGDQCYRWRSKVKKRENK